MSGWTELRRVFVCCRDFKHAGRYDNINKHRTLFYSGFAAPSGIYSEKRARMIEDCRTEKKSKVRVYLQAPAM